MQMMDQIDIRVRKKLINSLSHICFGACCVTKTMFQIEAKVSFSKFNDIEAPKALDVHLQIIAYCLSEASHG